jgi:hypothetical protein
MFAEIEAFLNELKELTHKFLPDSEIEVVYKRMDKVSIRILITRGLFIDVYANTETNRYDFSLIDNNIRIFGYDNLGGWHCHPFENPEIHIDCKVSSLESILEEIITVIDKRRKLNEQG